MPKNLGLYNNTLSVPRKKDIDAVQDTVDMHDSDIQQLETDVNGLNTEVSAVKTALTSKQNAITGAASTITDNNLTANRVVVSNNSGKVATSDITTTQLDYLKNPVTSVNGKTGAVVIDVDLSTVLKLTGGTMQGVIDMGGYKITNVATPTNNTDAANKAYADAQKGVEVLTQSAQPTDQVNGDMWFQTT